MANLTRLAIGSIMQRSPFALVLATILFQKIAIPLSSVWRTNFESNGRPASNSRVALVWLGALIESERAANDAANGWPGSF